MFSKTSKNKYTTNNVILKSSNYLLKSLSTLLVCMSYTWRNTILGQHNNLKEDQ